jgi:hypothetical protein
LTFDRFRCQNQDDVTSELGLPINQLLALFNKLIRKFSQHLRGLKVGTARPLASKRHNLTVLYDALASMRVAPDYLSDQLVWTPVLRTYLVYAYYTGWASHHSRRQYLTKSGSHESQELEVGASFPSRGVVPSSKFEPIDTDLGEELGEAAEVRFCTC